MKEQWNRFNYGEGADINPEDNKITVKMSKKS